MACKERRHKNMKKTTKKALSVLLSALLLCGVMAACGQVSAKAASLSASKNTAAEDTAAENTVAEDEILITLSDKGSRCEDGGVEIDGSVITITQEGDYRLTGTLSNGQIVVQADDTAKVKLILDGAGITCEGSAAIYAVSADKVVLYAEAGSSNLLASTGTFLKDEENNVDAAVFSKCDLNLSGEGAVTITCEEGHGVVSKDDLKVKSGTWTVEAAGKGLSGKDSVTVEDGTVNITAGTDGVYSDNGEVEGKGTIQILGGSLDIQCGKDGLDAVSDVSIEGGELNIQAGTDASDPGKGIQSDACITISGGSVQVDALDDAIHAGDSVTVSGGELTVSSSDDGIHADGSLTIDDGTLVIEKSYEGLEALEITVNGGEITVNASDDGLNAAGGSDGSNAYGPFGGDSFAAQSGVTLTINGGTLTVNAGGDGLDSNGDLLVTGGEVYVSGPTNSGNGAMDYNGTGTVTGGTIVAVGASGMAQNFGSASTQGTILYNLPSAQKAGTRVTLSDADGNILASYTPEKSYQSVVISAPGVEAGESYTLTAGTESVTIDMTSTVYGSGMGMGGFGGMGGPGMQNGGMERPAWDESGAEDGFGGMERPQWDGTDENGGPMGGGFGGPGMGGHGGFGGRR